MPSTGISVSNVFAGQPGPIPLSQLDADFTTVANTLNALATFSNYFVDSSGAANTITVTVLSPLVFSYVSGIKLQVKLANTNTSPTVNINVNGLGNIQVLLYDGTPPPVGSLIVGGMVNLIYDGVYFRVISQVNNVGPFTVNGILNQPSLSVKVLGGAAVGDFNVRGSYTGTITGAIANTDTGATSGADFSVGNGTNVLVMEITSTGFVGQAYPNSPNGQQALLASLGNIPLSFGTNHTAAIIIDGSQNTSFIPGGTNVAAFSSGAGGNAVIGVAGILNSIGFRTLTQTSIGAAGGASALPATPLGYMTVTVGGAAVKIPYYNP